MGDADGLTIMTTQFDSLDYAQRLARAGVPENQAAVHAQVLHHALGQIVCARQLSEAEGSLRKEIQQAEERLSNQIYRVRDEPNSKIGRVRLDLEAKIEAVRVELGAKIENLRVELGAKIEKVGAELDAKIDVLCVEIKYMRWMIGVVIALNTALLVKMFTL